MRSTDKCLCSQKAKAASLLSESIGGRWADASSNEWNMNCYFLKCHLSTKIFFFSSFAFIFAFFFVYFVSLILVAQAFLEDERKKNVLDFTTSLFLLHSYFMNLYHNLALYIRKKWIYLKSFLCPCLYFSNIFHWLGRRYSGSLIQTYLVECCENRPDFSTRHCTHEMI